VKDGRREGPEHSQREWDGCPHLRPDDLSVRPPGGLEIEPGRGYTLDAATHVGKLTGQLLESRPGVGRHGNAAEVVRPGEACLFQGSVRRLVQRYGGHLPIAAVRAGDQGEAKLQVFHRACQGAEYAHVPNGSRFSRQAGDVTAFRHPVLRRLEPEEPAEVGRDADGSAYVAAEFQGG